MAFKKIFYLLASLSNEKTCFENFSWSNINKIEKYSIGIEAFAKDLPSQDESTKLKGDIYYKNFNWFKTWVNNHFKEKFYLIWVYIPPYYYLVFIFKIKFNRIYEINMRYLKSDQFPYYLI